MTLRLCNQASNLEPQLLRLSVRTPDSESVEVLSLLRACLFELPGRELFELSGQLLSMQQARPRRRAAGSAEQGLQFAGTPKFKITSQLGLSVTYYLVYIIGSWLHVTLREQVPSLFVHGCNDVSSSRLARSRDKTRA